MASILVFLIGLGMLIVYHKFSFLFERWSLTTRGIYYAGAALFLLWGLKQASLSLYGQGPAEAAAANRISPRFPMPGLFYLLTMAVLFVGAVLGRSNMLILVFAMMAGPFVINGWVTYSMLKLIKVKRVIPRRVMAGEPFAVEFEVNNRKRLLSTWLLSVQDRVASDIEQLSASVLFARIPARSHRVGRCPMRLMQRGRYEFGPIQTSTRFPLGLVERGMIVRGRAEIIVYPRLGRLSATWKRDHLPGVELVHRRQSRRGAFDDDFHCIREYRGGDNPRRIHWRTSARHNELMVCEYHQSRDRSLVMLVDLWQPSDADEEDRVRVELAASLAGTMCVEHMRDSRDSHVDLTVAGKELTNWKGESSPVNMEPMLEPLAVAVASPSADDDRLIEHALHQRSPGTRLILVTTRSSVVQWQDRVIPRAVGKNMGEGLGDLRVVSADPNEVDHFFDID